MPTTTLPPVQRWGPRDAKNAVTQSLADDWRTNQRMIEEKDFWQNGDLWPGNRTGDAITDRAIIKNIEAQHVADDLVSEGLDNWVNGLLGHEASVTLDPIDEPPDDEGDAAIDAREREVSTYMRDLARWWDDHHFWRKVRATLRRSRYAPLRERSNVGRGDLRVWLPPSGMERVRPAPGRAAGRQIPTGLSLSEAFERIEVDDLKPDAGAVYVDPETRERIGVVITGEANTRNERVEIWTVEGRGENAVTRVRILSDAGARTSDDTARSAATTAPEFTLPLGGRLPIVEAESDMIVTAPLRKLQALLNFVLTVLPRTVETAGHKQRYLTNVEPPGMWLTSPPDSSPPLATETIRGVTYYKHRVPWTLGANITAELVGIRSTDPATKLEQYATPGVTIEEPTDPSYVTNSHEAIASLIRQRMKQGHLGNTATAEASGVAYEQARAQFAADLNNSRAAAEGLIRDTLYVVFAYAALMSDEARDVLARYRIVVNLHPRAGPVLPSESAQVLAEKAARVISRETAMSRLNVEDTSAEVAAIDEDPEALADLSLKRAAAANQWVLAGAGYYAAAILAGLSEDEARLFAQTPPARQPTQPTGETTDEDADEQPPAPGPRRTDDEIAA